MECNSGHLFCLPCTKKTVEFRIADLMTDLKCLEDKCNESYCNRDIENCLGSKSFKWYEDVLQHQCLKQARKDGILDGFDV